MRLTNWQRNYWPIWLAVFTLFELANGQRKNSLTISPEKSNSIHQVPVGQQSIFQCTANVEIVEKLSDFRWFWPDGRVIENGMDSRVEVGQQPGSINLFFSTVNPEDAGSYKCTAMYANTEQMTASFTLSTYVPITFEDAPVNQYAVKDTDFKVKCKVKADPSPTIVWKKDHQTISSNERYLIDTDGLIIKDVNEGDQGHYTCRVQVFNLGKVEERKISLEVQERPKIIPNGPKEVEGVEGESIRLFCGATGKPQPEFIWVNHRGQDLKEFERFTVDSYRGTLQIDGIRRDDKGTYQCTAKNQAGVDTMMVNVEVVTKPVIEEFKNVTSQVSQSTTLTCRASGDPPPDIFFQKDSNHAPFGHGSQHDTRIFTTQTKNGRMTTSTLKISDLLRSDDGLYNCIASNTRTRTELHGHLTVEFPPTFANTPMKENFSWNAQPSNLTCFVEAIPNATISWYFVVHPVERLIENDPHYQIFGHQTLSTLQVIPIDRTMYGAYRCAATNKLGTATHNVLLKEARPPGAVQQVIVERPITATAISFKIIRPFDDGSLPITQFVIQYKTRSATWNDYKTKAFAPDLEIYTVEDLEPMQTYFFRFAAENAVGRGEWAHEISEVMPKISSPEPPVIINQVFSNGIAVNPYPDRFELHWKTPADNGERIDHFQISYIQVRNWTDYQNLHIWQPYGSSPYILKVSLGEPRHIIRELTPDTFYKVEIRAHNKIGFSTPSEVIIKTAPSSDQYPRPDVLKGESGVASISLHALIIIVLICLFVILFVVDFTCYRLNQAGIIWSLSHCGDKSSPGHVSVNKSAMSSEKQPLNEQSVVEITTDPRLPNEETLKNGNKYEPKDSSV